VASPEVPKVLKVVAPVTPRVVPTESELKVVAPVTPRVVPTVSEADNVVASVTSSVELKVTAPVTPNVVPIVAPLVTANECKVASPEVLSVLREVTPLHLMCLL
jgi:hypothetical protein